MKVPRNSVSPWVIVAGGFHEFGGMDKANAALARYLLEENIPVHLVAHRVSEEFRRSSAKIHLVARPLNSFLLGEQALDHYGRRIAHRVTAEFPNARIVVNGGNCLWHDVNWVHSVHHAWPSVLADETPLWFRGKEKFTKQRSCRREMRAISSSRLVIANSERTRQDLTKLFNLDPLRIARIYLGADPNWTGVTPEEQKCTRAWLNLAPERKVIAFVGALGHDKNKGLDELWSAWLSLCSLESWDVDLVIAGGGRAVSGWQERVRVSGLGSRVRILGFSDRIPQVLAAADLLVSPVRYEAFGLNVHEAICRGIPALVTSSAGIAELYPDECKPMLLNSPPCVEDLRQRLLFWHRDVSLWNARFNVFGARIRLYTWRDMAIDLVNAVVPDDVPESVRDYVVSAERSWVERTS